MNNTLRTKYWSVACWAPKLHFFNQLRFATGPGKAWGDTPRRGQEESWRDFRRWRRRCNLWGRGEWRRRRSRIRWDSGGDPGRTWGKNGTWEDSQPRHLGNVRIFSGWFWKASFSGVPACWTPKCCKFGGSGQTQSWGCDHHDWG